MTYLKILFYALALSEMTKLAIANNTQPSNSKRSETATSGEPTTQVNDQNQTIIGSRLQTKKLTTVGSTLSTEKLTTVSSTLSTVKPTTDDATLSTEKLTTVVSTVKPTTVGSTLSTAKPTTVGSTLSTEKLTTVSSTLSTVKPTTDGATLSTEKLTTVVSTVKPTTVGSTLSTAKPTTVGSTLSTEKLTTVSSTLSTVKPTTDGATLSTEKLTTVVSTVKPTTVGSTLSTAKPTTVGSTLSTLKLTTLGSKQLAENLTTVGSTLSTKKSTTVGSTLLTKNPTTIPTTKMTKTISSRQVTTMSMTSETFSSKSSDSTSMESSTQLTQHSVTPQKSTQIPKTTPIVFTSRQPKENTTHEITTPIITTMENIITTAPKTAMTATGNLNITTTTKLKKEKTTKERTTKEKTTKIKKTRAPTVSRTTKVKTSTTEEDLYDLIGVTPLPPEPDKTALNVIEGSTLPNPIAIGAEKFEDLIKNGNIFIDKTLLIKDLMECNGSVKLINFPDGWGKTVNVQMMKTFFQLQINKKTNEILPRNETQAYKLFKHGYLKIEEGQVRKLRNPLLISYERDMMVRYQGEYFVVHLSFSGIKPKSYNDYMKLATARIMQTYKEHIYIAIVLNTAIKDPNCPEGAKEELKSRLTFFRKIITGKASHAELEKSISFLCQMLGEYYVNKTIILIEDYDKPLYEVLLYPKFPNKPFIVNFINNLMTHTLLKNNYYEHAIISGMINIKLTGITFQTQFNLLNVELLQYYGFNQREVDAIFDHLDIPSDLREKALLHYGGYKSGRELEMNISTPSSIAKFLASRQIENYWEGVEIFNIYLGRLFQIPHFVIAFLTITSDYTYISAISELEMTPLDFDTLSMLMRYSKGNKKKEEETFPVSIAMRLLYVSGYLTAKTYWPEQLHVACPNKETKSIVLNILYPFTTTPFYYD